MNEQEYLAPDGSHWTISLESDEDAESPRGFDGNVSKLVTVDSGYHSPDKDLDLDDLDLSTELLRFSYSGRVDMRYISRYINLFCPQIVGFAGLHRDGSGGLSTEPGQSEGDACGVGVVLRDDWDSAMGLMYAGDLQPVEAMAQEVATYATWAAGECVGYVITSDSGEMESCWGFYDEDDALRQAEECLPDGLARI